MSVLTGRSIRRWGIISPHLTRSRIGTLTYGEGPCGYDVRVEFDAAGEVTHVTLRPGQFLLCSTLERFRMPPHCVGRVCDKSSWARRGLAVQNTVIEPGWEGYLTLELTNHSDVPVDIGRGVPIAQVVFEWTDVGWWRRALIWLGFPGVVSTYEGKYQDQGRGPQRAR